MVIFVGDRPSPRMKSGARPFEGAVCENRLIEWGLFLNDEQNWIINQCDFKFEELLMLFAQGHKFIALGNNASKALKFIKHFKLPHPSFRNRLLNDPKYIKVKLKECKKWLEEQK